MQVEVRELEPGRFEAEVTGGEAAGTHIVLVPAGVGVPGASDETVVETVLEVLAEAGHAIPTSFDVTAIIRSHPDVWAEVEARLD